MMMPLKQSKGTIFHMVDDGGGHYYIIISDPDPADKVLVINFSNWDNFTKPDKSCVLYPKDHKVINLKSIVVYGRAWEMDVQEVYYRNTSLKIIKPPLTDEILLRIQNGAKKSHLLPTKFRKYFEFF